MKSPYIRVKIQKVLELAGALTPNILQHGTYCLTSVYAHISKPAKKDGIDVQYALIARFPRNGSMELGNINPDTRIFEEFSQEPSFYERAENGVVKEVNVLADQLRKLRTLDDVLAIRGISVERELIPSNK